MYNGQAVSGIWTGPQLRRSINCLELLAVRLALSCLRLWLWGRDVLVHTDNSDRCIYQPARLFTLPSHVATHPPPLPLESEASEVPSSHPHHRSVQSGGRRAVSSGTSWGVETPPDLESVQSCSGRPVWIYRNHPLSAVLLPIRGNARHGCTGTQLAPGPVQICVPPSKPASTDAVQNLGGWGAGPVSIGPAGPGSRNALSWAMARGASLADIYRAACWATRKTFTRFYSLRVEPVSSCVFSPQTVSGTKRPCSESACGVLKRLILQRVP